MSMVIELERGGRKAGHVCDRSYRQGASCPLILRQTSEDIITANVFGLLRRMRPSLWLRPWLNHAFKTNRFRSCSLAGLDVAFWMQANPPPTRAHREGSTEVDVLIRAKELIVFVEAKYRAPLSTRTKHDEFRDQVIRLLDVVFEMAVAGEFYPRAPHVVVLGIPREEPSLVTRYRDPKVIDQMLPERRRFADHNAITRMLASHLSYCSWSDLAHLLEMRINSAREMEQGFLRDTVNYIREKVATAELCSVSPRQAAHVRNAGRRNRLHRGRITLLRGGRRPSYRGSTRTGGREATGCEACRARR